LDLKPDLSEKLTIKTRERALLAMVRWEEKRWGPDNKLSKNNTHQKRENKGGTQRLKTYQVQKKFKAPKRQHIILPIPQTEACPTPKPEPLRRIKKGNTRVLFRSEVKKEIGRTNSTEGRLEVAFEKISLFFWNDQGRETLPGEI